MTINKEKPSNYNTCTPSAIAYDIQVSSVAIAQRLGYNTQSVDPCAMQRRLKDCNKTQLKAIAAELRTVEKRLEWILEGRY